MTDSKLTPKDKSIILQVIFKEVYENGKDPALVKADLVTFADMMFAAHDHYGAGGADEQRRSSGGQAGFRSGGNRQGGGGWQGGGGQSGAPYVPKYDKTTLPVVKLDYFGTGNAISFYDQRPAKEAGAYKPTAPDFSSVDKFEGKNIALWLKDANGNPNEDTQTLLAKAGGSTLQPDTSPF